MTWYAAHLVFYVRFKRRRQTHFPVWENIVLIRARTLDEAFAKAEQRGRDDPCMDPDDSFRWGGRPAEWVFGGVRKLTTCVDKDQRPTDGTEVTYLELKVRSRADLEKLIAAEPVAVRLEDGFPEEQTAAPPVNGRRKS
jgi:hypothetical protein